MENKQLDFAKEQTVGLVSKTVNEYVSKGELKLPEDYAVGNAMNSAWLILQELNTGKNNGYRPVLEACTQISIVNALQSMVIQGLQPDKKQCYFIPRGNKLVLMRSYFGSMAVAKRVDERIEEIYPEVIYQGDIFITRKERGKKIVVEHTQSIENINKAQIIGAYVQVVYKDGTENTEVMTFDEIVTAWMQSDNKPIDDKGNWKSGSVHAKFTAQMCKKTVVNRVCNRIINTSSDHSLLSRVAKATMDDAREAEVCEDISENANVIEVNMDGETYQEPPFTYDAPEDACVVPPDDVEPF